MSSILISEATDRAIRQRDLVPPAALASYHALVVGVGAVGRQVALQLAAMGVPSMTLIDHDVVAIENLAVQGYRQADLGHPKVDATASLCLELNPALRVDPVQDRFRRGSADTLACLNRSSSPTTGHRSEGADREPPKLAVFACVDSMSARRLVWETTCSRSSFHADGRMAGEVVRALAVSDPPTDQRYVTTLFEDASAHPAPCTGRSTLYAASLLAGVDALSVCDATAWHHPTGRHAAEPARR